MRTFITPMSRRNHRLKPCKLLTQSLHYVGPFTQRGEDPEGHVHIRWVTHSSLQSIVDYNANIDSFAEEAAPRSSRDSQQSSRDSEDQDSGFGHEPIQERYANPSYGRFRRVASKTIVSFGTNDPDNPVNWKTVRGIFPDIVVGGLLISISGKEIFCPRRRHHAGHEQHNWLIDLQQCHPRDF